MKKFLFLVILAGALGGGAYYWRYKNGDPKSDAPRIIKAKAERGPIILDVATNGRVVANLDVDIKCKASGRVITLPHDVSDHVTSGTLLFELDPVDETRNVTQARVGLRSSNARLKQSEQSLKVAEMTLATDMQRAEVSLKSAERKAEDARLKADRMEKLLEKKLASQEECESAETGAVQAGADLDAAKVRLKELETSKRSLELKRQDVELAKAEVESDSIALSISLQRLADTKVAAPLDGVISTRNVQIGQIIASGVSNVGGGTTVLSMSDLSRVFVLASVDESDIGRVAVGQTATIIADSFAGVTFKGEVIRIATKGVAVSQVVTFEVKIEVTSDNKSMLKPEMTTNVTITAQEKEDALLIPTEAVMRRGGRQTVMVEKDDGTTEVRPVDTGINDGFRIEITKGLADGETVIARRGEVQSRWRGGQGGPGGPGGAQRMMMMGGGMKGGGGGGGRGR